MVGQFGDMVCNVQQKNVTSDLMSSVFNVKAQWTRCMTSWCPYCPLNGKQEITVVYSPLPMSAPVKQIVFEVDSCGRLHPSLLAHANHLIVSFIAW